MTTGDEPLPPLSPDPPSGDEAPPVPVIDLPEAAAIEGEAASGQMSLGDHLEELRRRLLGGLAVTGAAFVVGLVFYRSLWALMLYPLRLAGVRAGLNDETLPKLQLLGLQDGFLLAAKLALFAALLAALPLLLYQAWLFVTPGLVASERRALRWILTAGSVLFLAGMAVAYVWAVPLGAEFLLRFNTTLPLTRSVPTVERYLGFLTMCCLGFGLAFETPLAMMALARVGLITPAGILRRWRYAALGMVVLGAIFTPPDPVTQVLLSGLMLGLYMLGYLLARWAAPRGEEADTDAEADPAPPEQP